MLDASAKQGILKPIRLVLVDRQPIVLQGLKSVLGTQQDFEVVASTNDGTSCLQAIRNLSPDVALIADTLPDLTASDFLAIANAEKLSTRLVFFTESEGSPDLTAAIAAGACSAISKYVAPGTMLRSLRLMTKSGVSLEPSDLAPAGKQADGGDKIEKMLELLTPRERQIVRLVSEGMSNKEIARRLDVSQGTVKVHLHNIFQKLEITNRTVLATISWLQRTSGFSALALAFLVFAVADELKATDIDDHLAHDDGPGHAQEHAGHEVWKKAILAHFVTSKPGGTLPFTEKDLLAKANQAPSPAVAMEALRAAEQYLGSKVWKDVGAVGSGTSNLPAHLLQAIGDAEIGEGAFLAYRIPLLASPSVPGGYGTFAAVAGALIYALSDNHLTAQASELSKTSIDSFLAGLGESATKQLAAASEVDASHAGTAASDVLSHDPGPHPGFVTAAMNVMQDVSGKQAGSDATGHDLQAPSGLVDAGHAPGGGSRDQITGGSVEDIVHRFPIDAQPAASGSVVDGASGPGRLNLAAFGGLAWLHLTAAAKSIPPHTLAWIYDPATNQTIVYVNPTDRVLDVGDRGLLEVHLQGIVSVAELDTVQHMEGGVHAVTLEQLETALLSAAAADETALSMNVSYAGEDARAPASVWSAMADDGLSFQFTQVRTGSGRSSETSTVTSEPSDTADQSTGPSGVPAYGSSIAPGRSATTPAADNLALKSDPSNSNSGAPSAQQSEFVPPDFDIAGSTGPGNSEAAKTTGPGAEHGNSDHAASGKAEEAANSGKGPGDTEHGHSQHDAGPGSAKAADAETTEAKPGKAVGNDHEPPSRMPDDPKGAETTTGHSDAEPGHSGHSVPGKEAEAGNSGKDPGGTEHGHSQHAAGSESAEVVATEIAEAKPKSGNDVGNDNEHHSQALDGSPRATKTAESGGAEHGNSSHSASAKGADVSKHVATDTAVVDNGQRAAHSGANAWDVAQPASAASKFGGTEQVFRFDGEAPPSSLALVEPKELHAPHTVLSRGDDHKMIVDAISHASDEHAQPADHSPHPGVSHGSHDLLI